MAIWMQWNRHAFILCFARNRGNNIPHVFVTAVMSSFLFSNEEERKNVVKGEKSQRAGEKSLSQTSIQITTFTRLSLENA